MQNDGWVHPLQYVNSDAMKIKPQASRRLMSEEAAWITWKTLTEVKVPMRFSWGLSQQYRPTIAWKTGTSWGNRDTWAIGSSKQHTVGVWVGKPNGEPLVGALGVKTAAPVLFSVFDMLNDPHEQPTRPLDVVDKVICWPDGRAKNLINNQCDKQLFALTKGGATARTLQIESGYRFTSSDTKNILLDRENGLRLSSECNNHTGDIKKVTVWPRQLEPWLPLSFKRSARIPTYSPDCLVIPQQKDLLTIVGIENEQKLFRIGNDPIALTLHVTGAFGKVNWYLNGRWLSQQVSTLLF